MKRVRLFESGGELPEEKIMALVMYLIKAKLLDPKSLDFEENIPDHRLWLITPFGRVKFKAEGKGFDHEHEGERWWTGTEQFWRRLGEIDYNLYTNAIYRGGDLEDLEYKESKSVRWIDAVPTNK